MRPFKFFFGAVLAISLLLFLARFVVIALVIATILTALYYLFGKVRQFVTQVHWSDDYDYPGERNRDLWWVDHEIDLLVTPKDEDRSYLHEFRRVAVD